ncbi:hypothetical protein BSKO_05936 [Bryopsis sp. KO-2023]|nr:hypothetical protein BSKO_05936 [Bryopsis sp. KO-2023]
MPPHKLSCLCSLLLAVAVCLPPDVGVLALETAGGAGRELLQSSVVTVDDAKSAKAVFKDLKSEQTIDFDFKKLTLTEPLNIDKDGVTIRGLASKSRPTITCPKASPAITISASNVTIENVEFKGCQDVPAVVSVTAPATPQVAEILISGILFSDVHFTDNDVSARNRGPLTIGNGVRAKVTNCVFSRNVGDQGGAISMGDGVLEVENSRFSENTAKDSGGAIATRGQSTSDGGTAVRISDCNFKGNQVIRGTPGFEPDGGASGKPLESSPYFGFDFGGGQGGAVKFKNVKFVLIQSSTFEENVASVGGALALVSDFTVSTGAVQIVTSVFDRNEARYVGERRSNEPARKDEFLQGGSIYMFIGSDGLQVALGGCRVTNSRAALGGGMHLVTSDQTKTSFNGCTFDGNVAKKAGGGVMVRNGFVDWVNSNVTNCKAEVGGGMLITNNADMQIVGPGVEGQTIVGNSNSVFGNNIAVDGGGISCVFCGIVLFQGPHFINNVATRNGGGLALLDGIGEVTLANYLFENNTALQGGGVYLDSIGKVTLQTPVQFMEINQPSVFKKNTAVAGGALFVLARSLRQNVLSVEDTDFVGNEAVELDDFLAETKSTSEDLLSGSLRKLKQADVAADQKNPKKKTTKQGKNTQNNVDVGTETLRGPYDRAGVQPDGSLSNSCGIAGGGAICLVLNEVPPAAIVNVIFFRVNLRKNKAGVGGGLFAAIDTAGWKLDAECPGSLPTPTADPCRSFRIETANITENVALHGGGGLFVSSPSSCAVKCRGDGITSFGNLVGGDSMTLLKAWKEGKQEEHCIRITDNSVLSNDGVFGPQIASGGVALELLWPEALPKMKQTSGGSLSFDEDPSNGITLRVVDAFNQTVAGGLKESEADVTLSTPSNVLRGQQTYKAEKGIVTVNSTDVLGEHTKHEVIFSAIGLPSTNTSFEIRDCYPGEEEGKDFKECRACGVDEYSFIPEAGCQECEKNAICNGGAALVPRGGYWHSTPFSPQFHECLVSAACRYPNRGENLLEFYEDPTQLKPSNDMVAEKDYEQCAEGYRGVLCGSCEDGYGHLVGGECTKCQSRSKIGWVTATVLVWSFVVILFEIAVSLSANRDFLKGAIGQSRKVAMSRKGRPPQETATGITGGPVSPPLLRSTGSGADVAPDEFIPDYVEAFESLTETGKIFVNYLQVTSLAVSINASWNRVVKLFLRWQESVTGISNGSTHFPLDCVFLGNYSIPKSVLALWLRIMFPVLMWILYLSLIGGIWLTMRYRRMRNANDIGKYVTVMSIALAFFAYNPVTEDLLRTVNCLRLDDPEDYSAKNPHGNFTVAIRGRVWAEDTDLRCFQGDHTATGVFGLIGLCSFTFGFIVFIVVLLAWNRDKVNDEAFLSRYGFLYRTYRTHHNRESGSNPRYGLSFFAYHTEFYTIYWEAFVTLRKVLIGGAVVYAYHLGPNLQAVLALGILFLALFFQLLFRPYRDIRTKKCGGFLSKWMLMEIMTLNHLEALSILMSAITFYSGVVFNDHNTSEGGKITMAVFVVLSNGAYFLLMLLRLWGGLHVALDEKIKFLAEEGGADSECDRPCWITRLSMHDYDARVSWVTKIAVLVDYYTTNISTRIRNTSRVNSRVVEGMKNLPSRNLPLETLGSSEPPPQERV